MADTLALDDGRLRQGTNMGAWLTVLTSMVNGMNLWYQEWRDDLFLRYKIDPPDPPLHCDGCNAKISIRYYLDCKKVSLITTRHNKICVGVSDLSGKAFNTPHMHDDLLINTGHSVQEVKAHPEGSPHNNLPVATGTSEKKVDLIIRDLCQIGMDSIHDMRVMNTDALSHRNKSPYNFLHMAEKEK